MFSLHKKKIPTGSSSTRIYPYSTRNQEKQDKKPYLVYRPDIARVLRFNRNALLVYFNYCWSTEGMITCVCHYFVSVPSDIFLFQLKNIQLYDSIL